MKTWKLKLPSGIQHLEYTAGSTFSALLSVRALLGWEHPSMHHISVCLSVSPPHTQKHIHRHTYTPPLKLGQAQIRHFLNEVIYQQLDTKLEQQHHLVGTGERLRVPLPLLHSGHYFRFQSPADQRFQDENSETTGKVLHAYSETLQITARLCGLIVCTHWCR